MMTYARNETAAAVAKGLAAANDRPRPGDAHKSAANYAALSDHFRAGAWHHLRVDADLTQASNKAWGMVAETVKAICAEHGRVIHTHRSFLTGHSTSWPIWFGHPEMPKPQNGLT